MTVETRYLAVRAAVDDRCIECGRDPREVKLIAVSKTVGPEQVAQAVAAGSVDFGENRPEQLMLKAPAFPQASWHFIGNVQSRRIPEIVAHAALIHSLYQEAHLAKADAAAARLGKVQDILIEVNESGEEAKGGCAPSEAASLVLKAASFKHLRVRGLMTMAAQGDASAADASFARLAETAQHIRGFLSEPQRDCFTELSMGMSEDWRIAIARGATMIRIGRAIFSDTF